MSVIYEYRYIGVYIYIYIYIDSYMCISYSHMHVCAYVCVCVVWINGYIMQNTSLSVLDARPRGGLVVLLLGQCLCFYKLGCYKKKIGISLSTAFTFTTASYLPAPHRSS